MLWRLRDVLGRLAEKFFEASLRGARSRLDLPTELAHVAEDAGLSASERAGTDTAKADEDSPADLCNDLVRHGALQSNPPGGRGEPPA